MENLLYHVVLDGRKLGPYDRRTIVGMKVKKTLTSQQTLVGADGVELTVADLVRQGLPEGDPNGDSRPGAGASYSVVQGIHPARLLEVQGSGYAVPPFKDEVEVRVQTRVLRVSGRYREGIAWKEERVKFPLQDIVHARLRGSVVDLWVRTSEDGALQRISLDLLQQGAAGELAESLPHTSPWPGSEPLAAGTEGKASASHPMLWGAVVGTALAVGSILAWVLVRGH